MSYKRFEDDDIVKGNPTEVTTGIWSGDTGSLSAFYTSSTQALGLSGQYYWNMYNIDPSSSLAEVQFAVAYGHRLGGGNQSLSVSNAATLSTQATYFQYRNLLLEPGDPQFTFLGNYSTDHIYIINLQRSRLKEEVDPGNWQLNLSGSNGVFSFVDDSGQTLGNGFGKAGAVFNVVSGSLSGSAGITIASPSSSAFGGFGLVYPGLGLIVLNPDAIKQTVGLVNASFGSSQPFAPNTGSVNTEYNHAGLWNSMRLARLFQARSAENISSTHYFVRLRNKEYNYSNNPSFVNQTNGQILNSQFINDPRVYVTTVGMYNDNNELLAVAKLSMPVQKSFDKELLIRARLDW